MGKRMLGCLVLAICMLGLGGCMFGNVDEMYALPKSSEAYVNLQAKINQEKGSAEYIAPLSGENRQTIQLVDVDGDGVQEAVAFFRDTTSENPLKIVIFKQDEHEEYQVYTRIEGVGSEIESIDYLDLGGKRRHGHPGELAGQRGGAHLGGLHLGGRTACGDHAQRIQPVPGNGPGWRRQGGNRPGPGGERQQSPAAN